MWEASASVAEEQRALSVVEAAPVYSPCPMRRGHRSARRPDQACCLPCPQQKTDRRPRLQH